LCVHGFAGGWPSIFYMNGTFMVIWLVVFAVLASDSPNTHRFITTEEKNYIIEETRGNNENEKKKPVSLKRIFFLNFIITTSRYKILFLR
jgi:ACS family sodium-dependent inorganic phosphate cotransporter-like MFS transporter 5